MIKKYTLTLVVFFVIAETYAQLRQTSRYELEIKQTDEPYYLIPADTSGMFIFHRTKEYSQNNKRYDLSILNKDLELVKDVPLFVNDKYQWLGYEFEHPDLYLLYRQGDYNKSDFYIAKVNSQDYTMETFDVKNEMDIDITHFTVSKETAIIGGYVNQRPAVVLFDFEKEQITILPGFYIKDSKLIDISVNVNKTFNVIIYNEESSINKNLQVKVYDWKGNLLAEDLFKVPPDKHLLSGLSSRLINDNLVLTGTFGSTGSNITEGFYWAKADLAKDQEIKLIPYSAINSFFDHLPEKRQEKMKSKSEDSSKDFVHKEHVILHRMIEHSGRYYVLAEKFDPDYVRPPTTGSPYVYNYRVNPYNYNRNQSGYVDPSVREFAKVEYEQAFVVALNESGEILWDQALVMDNVESGELEQIADLNIDNDNIAIAYKDEDVLNYKLINGGETIKGDTTVNIMLGQVTDILRDEEEEEGGVKFWYEGTFYVWGYQSIKRTTDEKNERLYIFYINKLEMD